MNAVDTNVLSYSIDQNEPVKQAKAQQLFRQLLTGAAPTFLLWQVLGECVQQLRRWRDQGKVNDVDFQNHVQVFRNVFPLVLPAPGVLDHALDLSSRYSLSHWDSMILGACKEANIAILYTEDMGAPRSIDGIQLINPLI
jgi:predicted nucleic acid-binding protein